MVESTEITKYDSGLEPGKHNELVSQFNPMADEMSKLVETAKGIEVKDVNDAAGMDAARTTRLGLKKVRVSVEKTRKSLKEASLREGKAIDGMANILKFIIAPVEERLQLQEDTAKEIEAKRVAEVSKTRIGELSAFGVDCEHFDLANMPNISYQNLLASSKAGYETKQKAEADEKARQEAEAKAAKEAAELKAKEEAAQREADRIERERIETENAKLREEKKAAEAEARKEREAREHEQKEAAAAKAKAAREEAIRIIKEQAKEDADVKAAKEAEQARLSAPDKVKLAALEAAVSALDIPAVSSDVAMMVVLEIRTSLNDIVKGIRLAIKAIEAK